MNILKKLSYRISIPICLFTFFIQANTPEDVKILIPTHIENGECAQARALLNTIDIGQEENKQFVKLYDVLTSLCEASEDEAGEGGVVVSEEQEARINEVSTTETQVSVHAASFLAQLHKTTIKRTPERIIVPQGMMFQNSNNENKFEGLMEEKTSFLHVYPNPSEEQIVVSNTNKTNSEIIISDALGRIHFNGNLNEANLYQLTLSLTKGMYVVKQITEDGKVNTKSILIKD